MTNPAERIHPEGSVPPDCGLDPYAATYQQNPYPLLRDLFDAAPIAWSAVLDAWLVGRYADVRDVILRDSDFRTWSPLEPEPEVLPITLMDGRPHRALRMTLAPHFTRGALRRTIQPLLEPLVSELADEAFAAPEVDLVAAYANRIPARVIRLMTGVPEAERPELAGMMERMLEADAAPHIEALQPGVAEAREMLTEAAIALILREREAPAGNLVSALLASRVDGRPMTEAEVASFAILLVVAGIETTQRLVANMAFILAQDHELQQSLRADRRLLAAFVEEALRIHPPNQFRMRFAAGDMEHLGVQLKRGDKIFAMIAAANRDARVYAEPDAFDLGRGAREEPHHLAFGIGVHHCLGATLARIEGEIALAALLDRTDWFRPADTTPVTFRGFRNRSPTALRLRLERS
ncbi:MAG: cytochrome P450 [Thermaurantiacus sp.]